MCTSSRPTDDLDTTVPNRFIRLGNLQRTSTVSTIFSVCPLTLIRVLKELQIVYGDAERVGCTKPSSHFLISQAGLRREKIRQRQTNPRHATLHNCVSFDLLAFRMSIVEGCLIPVFPSPVPCIRTIPLCAFANVQCPVAGSHPADILREYYRAQKYRIADEYNCTVELWFR